MIASNVQGEVLVFNPGAERITGWKASEVIGKRMVKALYPGDGVIDFASITAAVEAAGYTGDVEVEIFNQDVWDSPYDVVAARTRDAFAATVAPFLM